jgi:hypothetical protein
MSKRIYLSSPDVGQLEESAIVAAVRSGWIAPLGPDVDAFEVSIAEITEREHAVALSSGTAALHLSLLGMGIGQGDVVLTSTMTFAATANAICYVGAEPVFIDSDEEAGNVSVDLLEEALTDFDARGERVAAVLPVDLLGRAADYSRIVPLAERFGVPIVVTGFEPLDLLEGIRRAVVQLEQGRHEVENAYARVVPAEGNPAAVALLHDVFEVCDRTWRGIGTIPASGWRLAEKWAEYDAEQRFDVDDIRTEEPPECLSGLVLRGLTRPTECPAFGRTCTPSRPLGATMVSSEGACAAYFAYRRLDLVGQ